MKRRRKNQKKERAIMLCSSVLVLSALTLTGIYVKEKNQVQDDGYVVDLSRLEPEPIEEPSADAEATEESETVSSTKIENRDTLLENDYSIPTTKGSDFMEENITDKFPGSYDFLMEEEEFSFSEEEELSFLSEEKLSFSEEEQLLWPVVGNVLINYSMESPVYFATLEQYKCNPAIIIQAKQGQNINAAAKGKVSKIQKTEELGNVITMDLGSGYEIIYGQLENMQVKEGDMVEKGDYLADVAATTKYYSVEGDNIYFALKKDGKPENPMTKLQ